MIRMSRAITWIATAATLLAPAACRSGGPTNPEAVSAVYNATFTGAGTIQRDAAGLARGTAEPAAVSLTLSQLGSNFSGTMTLAPPPGAQSVDGAVAGRTTRTGGTFTYVLPGACAGTLYGDFTISSGKLTGAATGRDCRADGADNIRITFTALARQP